MTIKIGINGFGRMGRLSMRAAYDWDDIEIVQINDPAGDAATLAHLMTFDSVHGKWHHDVNAENAEGSSSNNMIINGHSIPCTQNKTIAETDWSQCDVVIEASGKMKSKALLQAYLDQGVKRVVVTAPVKEDGVLNIVMGVNDNLYNQEQHPIVTAASCTTNCISPVAKIISDKFGIEKAMMTTIHAYTSDQRLQDGGHKDLRRARAAAQNIIPTSTGATKATSKVVPDLKDKFS